MMKKTKNKDYKTWWDRFDSTLLKKVLRIKNKSYEIKIQQISRNRRIIWLR